jgi:tetratricopeptide (TPR) repeat protein
MTGTLRSILVLGALAAAPALAILPAPAAAQVSDDLREADRHYDSGDFRKAAAAYDRAIRKHPSQVPPEAYGKRAAIYLQDGQTEAGLAFVRDVAKRYHADAADVLAYEAAFLWKLGQRADAVNIAERAAAANRRVFIAQRLIGEFYARSDAQKTADAYDAYLAHRPSELERDDVVPRAHLGLAHLRLAMNALNADDRERAVEHGNKAIAQFEELRRRHGKNPVAINAANSGMCAANMFFTRPNQAITACEQVVKDPRRVDSAGSAWYNLGKAYLKNRQYAKAREAATAYRQKQPRQAKGLILVGDTFFAEGNWDRAIEAYEEAERLKPESQKRRVDLAINLGLAYKSGPRPNLDKAVAKLETARQDGGSDPRLASALAEIYLAQKKDDKALTETEKLINGKGFAALSARDRASLLVVSGKAHYNTGKLKESRERLLAAHGLRKEDVVVRRALVQSYQRAAFEAFNKQDYKQAESHLDEATKVEPAAPGVALNRAVIAIEQKDCEGAQRHLGRIQKLPAYQATYQRLMARTFLCARKPNPKKAAEHYALAEAEARKVGANHLLAEVYTEWGPLQLGEDDKLDTVVEHLQSAVQFTTGGDERIRHVNTAARRNLAIALYRRGWKSYRGGRAEQALSDFDRARREPGLLKGTEPLAFDFSYALALLDKDSAESQRLFKQLDGKGNRDAYLKAPYNKVGPRFFAAYASYRAGTSAGRQQAAREFEQLQKGATGAFANKIKELIASSHEYVAFEHWRSGKETLAGRALEAAARFASGDIERRVRHNRAVLSMSSRQLSLFEGMGSSPPEALVNVGVLHDQAGKPKEAYEAWRRAKQANARARDLDKWISAKQRIYGFN